ncbi:MAG: TAXI family TRAP transporter solute-binding subunit [Hyphomicrobiaceae bacterium]
MLRLFVRALAILMCLGAMPVGAFAQSADDANIVVAQRINRAPTAAAVGESDVRERINSWTVGMAAGLPEGTYLHVAAEIARNVNESKSGDELRLLPVVTPGATENVRDLLYLKGIDIAITATDVFEHFRTIEKIRNIEKRVHYISALYVSEVHLLVRPEIKSIKDLEGKKVSLHTKGSGSTVTGPIVFRTLGVKVEPVYISNAIALEKMKTGEIAGLIHNGGKPNPLLTRFKNTEGFHFIEIPFDRFDEFYVPGVLSSKEYPNFLKPGEKVETIGVPAVLAVYNWPTQSDRYRRVSRFIDHFFDRFERFKGPGYRGLWKDVNLAAQVPGWTRFAAAEEKLKEVMGAQAAAPKIDTELARQQAARVAPGDPAEQERLFQRFLEWAKKQNARQTANR